MPANLSDVSDKRPRGQNHSNNDIEIGHKRVYNPAIMPLVAADTVIWEISAKWNRRV